jgi:hypothetical protein
MRESARADREYARAHAKDTSKLATESRKRIGQDRKEASSAKRKARVQISMEEKILRAKKRGVRQAVAGIKAEEAARKRAAHTAVRTARQQRKAALAGIGRGAGGGARGLVTGALGAAGIFGGVALIQGTREFEAQLTDLMITGNKTTEWLHSTRKAVLGVSDATGKGKGEVASYLSAIVEQTGDADFAVATLKTMGEVAVATGANMGDLGGVMVKLGGLNILRAQEKQGSVTMANISAVFGRVASLAPQFGEAGKGLGGVRALGGLLQISARGFGREEVGTAATSAQRFLQNLALRRKKIEKAFKVKLGEKRGGKFQFNDLVSVFRTLSEAFAKDPERFTKKGLKLFGLQGIKTAQQLQAVGISGFGKASGKFAAASAIFGAGKKDVISADAAKRRASTAFKFDQAIAQLSNTFQRKALPLVTSLTKALPTLVKALKLILDNSTLLISLWLGAKGAALFRRMLVPAAAAGGAGAAGAAGGVVTTTGRTVGRGGAFRQFATGGRSMGSNIAGGALTAAPLIPFAIQGGIKIAEVMAGTTAKQIAKDYSAILEHDLGLLRKKHKRELEPIRKKIAAREVNIALKGTERGAKLVNQIRQTTLPYLETAPGGGKGFALGEVFRKGGVKGARALRDRLTKQREQLRGVAVAAATEAGLPTDRKTLEAMPGVGQQLKVMRQMAEAIDMMLARGEREGRLTVDGTISVFVGDQPGDRAARGSNVVNAGFSPNRQVVGSTGQVSGGRAATMAALRVAKKTAGTS